jgi:hypothetical protein
LGNILGDFFSPTHLVTLLGKQTRWSGQHFFVKKLRSKDDWGKWAKFFLWERHKSFVLTMSQPMPTWSQCYSSKK